MNTLNIGFFDSGIGGLAFLQGFQTVLNADIHYNIFYVADNGGFPYGEKTKPYLIERILSLTSSFIEKKQLDILVIACNTASVLILEKLRTMPIAQTVEIVGVVPAIKPAVEQKYDKIYVMSTKSTAETTGVIDVATHTKEKYGFESKVFLRPCQTLVQSIEMMMTHTSNQYKSDMMSELKKITDEIIAFKSQAVVLGCTHYLHIKAFVRELLPLHIEIIDPLEGVNNRILVLLQKIKEKKEHWKTAVSKNIAPPDFFLTKQVDEAQYKFVCKKFNLKFQGVL